MKTYTIDRWYDRSLRSWIIQLMDENDFQVGEAVFVYSKKEAFDTPLDYMISLNEEVILFNERGGNPS
jgi:hypothetical protein